ncbi:MAG: ATP-binding protein [Lapillicoccus sp.]
MSRPTPTVYLTVGLPGTGKTTWATQSAQDLGILRLTPDDWMAPLFGVSDVDGKRDVLEGRLIWVAHEVAASGSSVVLDFGCWSSEERYAIRAVADHAGAGFVLRYFEVPEPERRARADRRWRDTPGTTFEMTDADHDRFLELCRPPLPEELAYAPLPPPPAGSDTWLHWAADRWPTLGNLGAESLG